MAVLEAGRQKGADIAGRVVALLIAVLAGWLAWDLYDTRLRTALPGAERALSAEQLQEMAISPAVQACAEARYQQIAQMVADGFMDEAAAAEARQRAFAVCASRR